MQRRTKYDYHSGLIFTHSLISPAISGCEGAVLPGSPNICGTACHIDNWGGQHSLPIVVLEGGGPVREDGSRGIPGNRSFAEWSRLVLRGCLSSTDFSGASFLSVM